MRTGDTGPMTASVKTFRGLHNTGSPLRLPSGALTVADNINITDTGAIERRSGYERATTMALSGAFATEDGSRLYVVDAGVLQAVHADHTSTTLMSGLGTGPVQWAQFNDRVLFCTNQASGIINPDHEVLPWAWPMPEMPTLSAGTGALDAGQYAVSLTHVLDDGRETGASPAVHIDLPAGSALQVSGIVQRPGMRVRVYVCPANGAVFQRAGDVTGAAFTWDASANSLGAELATDFMEPLPGADVLAVWRGRVCAALHMPQQDQSVVFSSEPLAPHLFKVAANFFMVPGTVTMLAPHDSGLIVGTDKAIHAYNGDQIARLADYGVVPGSPWAATEGRILFWTTRGVCQFPEFQNLTQKAVSLTPGVRSGVCVVDDGGQSRLVVAVQKGGAAFNPRPQRT